MPANADRLGYPANATSAADAANSPNSPNSAHRPTKLTGQLRPPTAAANASQRRPTNDRGPIPAPFPGASSPAHAAPIRPRRPPTRWKTV